MNIKVVVFALVMTASMGAQGKSFYTGKWLLEKCDEKYGHRLDACLGYITGVHDTVATLAHWEGFAEYMCTPKGVTSGQFRLVVMKHLNKHPEELHLNAGGLVLNALSEAFPCE